MTKFRVETKFANMEFHACKAFEVHYGNKVVSFSVLPEYYTKGLLQETELPPKDYLATGKASVIIEAEDPQKAMADAKKFFFAIEHLLTLAHQHHVFYTTVSCFPNGSNQAVCVKGLSGRMGPERSGSLLRGDGLEKFLNTALPRLDEIPGFRWGLYMFNEVTALSNPVAQLQITSLWTALELIVHSWANSNQKSKLVASKDIEKLKDPIKQTLLPLGYSERVIEVWVYPQLGALQRPPIMVLCNEFLTFYKFEDYEGVVRQFYKHRNEVVHARNLELVDVDPTIISKFERLMQKILFSLAGVYDDDKIFLAPIRGKDLLAR